MTSTNPALPARTGADAAARANLANQEQAAARRAVLIEDTEWMAATGETMPGAAARLHKHPGALRDALTKAGRRDLWARLLANGDPAYPVQGRIGRAA